MVSWFTDNSTLPMVTGVIMVIILLGLAFSAREKTMVYLAIVIGVLTAGTVACERFIVTDREEVTARVYDLAEAVQANDKSRVLEFVSNSRQDTIGRVNGEMPRYDFDTCRLVGVNYYEPKEDDANQRAEICFVVSVRVRLNQNPELLWGQRKVTLHFEKEADGKWRVIDYSHEDPRSGLTM